MHIADHCRRPSRHTKGPGPCGRLFLSDEGAYQEPECQLTNAVHVAGRYQIFNIFSSALIQNVQDIIELRERKWIPRNAVAARVGPDGWPVAGSGYGAPRPPPKVGDLSNFGKISKAQPMTFGPSSIFAGKKGTESKRESISQTSSSSNMFSMLSQNTEAGANNTAKGDAFTQIIG